jgi:hypothetical protein
MAQSKRKEAEEQLKALGSSSIKQQRNKKRRRARINQTKNMSTRKKKTKTRFLESIDFPRLLRLIFFALIIGFFVYQYYLLSEGKLDHILGKLWIKEKDLVVPSLLFLGYTLFIYYLGYIKGKKK